MPKRIIAACLLTISLVSAGSLSAKANDNSLGVVHSVQFSRNDARLDAKDKSALLAALPKLNAAATITITGYEQKTANTKNKSTLGLKRAIAVKKFLVSHGVKARISVLNGYFPKALASSASSRKVNIRITSLTATPTTPVVSPSSPTTNDVTVINYFQPRSELADCTQTNIVPVSVTLSGNSSTRTQNLNIQNDGQRVGVPGLPQYINVCEYKTVFTDVIDGSYVATTSASLTQLGVDNNQWSYFYSSTEDTAQVPASLAIGGNPPIFSPGSIFGEIGSRQNSCNYRDNFANNLDSQPVVGVNVVVNGASLTAPRIYMNEDC